MKRMFQEMLLALLLGVGVPALMFHATLAATAWEEPPTAPTEETKPKAEEQISTIRLLDGGELTTLSMEEYILGVVLQEMPGDFHLEAKKAQAVAARTYAIKASNAGTKHPVGVICSDSGCCQAYRSPQSYLSAGGSPQALEEARLAVSQTSGQVLTYQGKVIDATYFSCSGGYTEDALAVWGSDVPYLRAVESPGEEKATHFADSYSFTIGDFCDRLGIQPINLMHYGIGTPQYTDGGGVETISIGGKTFTGLQLRQLLSLRSTAITVGIGGNGVSVTTRGFGHRVGMSQYGADAMAALGADYKEILQHYYQGTKLETRS